ncbi:nickel-dependent hydrogenase large subunit [Desulfopila aestuarii]|uniref:Hydrogenase large subunit n=1 Tax=Desulfopila aestuarii DSM 18488 TaxID=1121416 RepID=A0A1M7Y351_9BACT|nr:nickel-dependent hydrogenase large subunit [Desulfopila aestuarii]SHO46435.1 hydrogenase large subunit [Desulfopila aestuarii DSM 18488]
MVKTAKGINIPLNRAEGDLEIRVEVNNGVVTESWSSGTMFRGFEAMMQGRGALDGLVITPRVCGICSLTHLTAAVEALDAITGIKPPDNARRLRNLALMVETIQSDIRQAVLMFMADFANQNRYHDHPLSEEACNRYSPLTGRAAIEVIRESKRLLQVVAIIGGQWPHTSFMVPGGVTSIPEISKILQCRIIIDRFRTWYERSILGCPIERWQQIESEEDLHGWLLEKESHRESEVGFFLRFARQANLDTFGRGPNRYLSFGNFPLPVETDVQGHDGRMNRAGYASATDVSSFDPEKVTEDLSHSWYEQGSAPAHPFSGRTKPYASGQSGELYSWIKAPRYNGEVVETGPLAEMIIDGNPLFIDMIKQNGPNILVRELARLVRPAHLLQPMSIWVNELLNKREESFYHSVTTIPDGEGAGLIQAARGALGHWLKVEDEKIVHYQIITPSAWNGSPRDASGARGAWEEALIGTPIRDIKNPVEAGHVVRSFDPCLVCAVHCLQKGSSQGILKMGLNR